MYLPSYCIASSFIFSIFHISRSDYWQIIHRLISAAQYSDPMWRRYTRCCFCKNCLQQKASSFLSTRISRLQTFYSLTHYLQVSQFFLSPPSCSANSYSVLKLDLYFVVVAFSIVVFNILVHFANFTFLEYFSTIILVLQQNNQK